MPKLKPTVIILYRKGNVAELKVDCLVLPINEVLQKATVFAMDICQHAGPGFERNLDDIMESGGNNIECAGNILCICTYLYITHFYADLKLGVLFCCMYAKN